MGLSSHYYVDHEQKRTEEEIARAARNVRRSTKSRNIFLQMPSASEPYRHLVGEKYSFGGWRYVACGGPGRNQWITRSRHQTIHAALRRYFNCAPRRRSIISRLDLSSHLLRNSLTFL